MRKINFLLIIIVLVFFGVAFFEKVAASDLMGLSLDVKQAGLNIDSGNISIEIWDASSSGNLIYNSTNAFDNNITNGRVDIMLGSSTSGIDLNLTYGTIYYMDIYVNENDINFSGNDRQEFQSSIGNITFANINVSTSIIPDANITFDLGSPITYFKNLYINAINILTNLAIGGNSPSYILDVDGNASIDGSTFIVDDVNNRIGILTLSPTHSLNVYGDLNITGDAFFESNVTFLDNLTVAGNVFYVDSSSKRVGIGTTTPSNTLDIRGDLNVSGKIYYENSTEAGSGGGGAWAQGTDTIYNDSSGIRIGIGTPSPTMELDVYGALNVTNITLTNITFSDGSIQSIALEENMTFGVIVGLTSSTYDGNISNSSDIGYVRANMLCDEDYPGSHFCLEAEILKSISNGEYSQSGTSWMAKGAPGYTAEANDCSGWTTDSTSSLGPFWNWDANTGAGEGKLTNCGQSKKLTCCKGKG